MRPICQGLEPMLGRGPRVFVFFVVVCCLALSACRTVVIRAEPGTTVDVDGQALGSAPVSFVEKPGIRDHVVTVRKDGRDPMVLVVERRQRLPWLRVVAWILSGAGGMASAAAGCAAGAVLGNAQWGPGLISIALAPELGQRRWVVFRSLVANTITAPHAGMVPMMALGALLGAWPMVGLVVPELLRFSDEEIVVPRGRER